MPVKSVQLLKNSSFTNQKWRGYSLCGPPRVPPGQCGCPSQIPGVGRRIEPPVECRPAPIPLNPCMPRFNHGKDSWKRYRLITFLVCFPLIIIQTFHALGHKQPHKVPCRDFEYMRIRTKKYPWGSGNETFFHNKDVNHLPGECEAPPPDCD